MEESLKRWRYALERRGLKVRSKIECVWMKLQRVELRKVDEFKYLGVSEICNVYFRSGDTGKKMGSTAEGGRFEDVKIVIGSHLDEHYLK